MKATVKSIIARSIFGLAGWLLIFGCSPTFAYETGYCTANYCCRDCYGYPTYDPNSIANTHPCRLFWTCSNNVATGYIHQLQGHNVHEWRCKTGTLLHPTIQTSNCGLQSHCNGNDYHRYTCSEGSDVNYNPCVLTIEQNSPACCISHYETRCYLGDVWWYNSCGVREELRHECPGDCQNGACVCTDGDGDTFKAEGGICGDKDCDDSNPDVNPEAIEICDLIDNDCNEQIDDGTCIFCPAPVDTATFLDDLVSRTFAYLTMSESLNGNGIPNNWYETSGSTGDYTSPEEIGFYILAQVYAELKNLIDANTARARVIEALDRLENDLPVYDATINQTLWTIGDDEAPPVYDQTAFDEFDQSGFDSQFYVDTEAVSEFPKELNDWSTDKTYIHFNLSEIIRNDLTLTLGTLYATHGGQPYFDMNIKVKKADGSYHSLGVLRFGSGSSSYPEELTVSIPQSYVLQGQNTILLENEAGQYSGKWVIWDHLKLVNFRERKLYYQFYNTANFAVSDNTLASLSNTLLAVSLVTASQRYQEKNDPAVYNRMNSIINKIDLRMFYDSNNKRFFHIFGGPYHWDHYSDSSRLISFAARVLNALDAGEFAENLGQLAKSSLYYDIKTKISKSVSDSTTDILVQSASWNGTTFGYFVPALFIQEHLTDYYDTTLKASVDAQISYCQYSQYTVVNDCVAWGKSDAYDASSDYCDTYNGGPPTVANYLHGTPYESCGGVIAPFAIALQLNSHESDKVLGLLDNLSTISGLYHTAYGFTDSTKVGTSNHAERFDTLHQELLLMAIMNYRDQTIWNYFYQYPRVVEAHNLMFPTNPLP